MYHLSVMDARAEKIEKDSVASTFVTPLSSHNFFYLFPKLRPFEVLPNYKLWFSVYIE